MSYKNFSYVYANLPSDEWEVYTTELKNLYKIYGELKDSTTLFVSKDLLKKAALEEFKEVCPVLYSRIKQWNIHTLLYTLAFVVVPPNYESDVHIDTYGIKLNDEDFSIALNFPVINGKNSYTVFYEIEDKTIKNDATHYIKDYSSLNNNNNRPEEVIFYNMETAKEIERVEAVRPYWVNTSIPHRPVNNNHEYRVACSIRFNWALVKMLETNNFSKMYVKD